MNPADRYPSSIVARAEAGLLDRGRANEGGVPSARGGSSTATAKRRVHAAADAAREPPRHRAWRTSCDRGCGDGAAGCGVRGVVAGEDERHATDRAGSRRESGRAGQARGFIVTGRCGAPARYPAAPRRHRDSPGLRTPVPAAPPAATSPPPSSAAVERPSSGRQGRDANLAESTRGPAVPANPPADHLNRRQGPWRCRSRARPFRRRGDPPRRAPNTRRRHAAPAPRAR